MGKFKWETCCQCKTRFAMSDQIYRIAIERREGFLFYCPNGHSQHYVTGKSQVDIERERAENFRRQAERAVQAKARLEDEVESARRSASAYKGAATRLKNRAKAGMCPCCNRTFQNLARHMASQHPDEEADNVVEFGQSA